MGLFDKLKNTFTDQCKVDTTVQGPEAFRWGDASVTAMVEVRNTSDEPRQLTGIDLTLATPGADPDSDRQQARPDGTPPAPPAHVEHLTLGPGESITRQVTVTLDVRGSVEDAFAESPAWLKKAAGAMAEAAVTSTKDYELRATPLVVGFRAQPGRQRIRALD
jgi:hypothetical protein